MPRPDIDLEKDLSELEGLTYSCIDGCALCCLCQPELLPEEEERFRKQDRLTQGISERHISPDVRGAAIRLKGEHGACHFLSGRRCRIYDDRPHYCRAFPISMFSGWRIQASANLSCRGMGLPGESLGALADRLISAWGEEALARELDASRRVFADFTQNARDARVAQSVSSVRTAADAVMDDLADEIGLSRLLTYAQDGRTKQNSTANEIARKARGTDPEARVNEVAAVNGTELFDLPDLSYLPVYIDSSLVWRIFRLEEKEIIGYVLSEDGETEEFSRTDPDDLNLLPLTTQGRETLVDYMRLVNRRDCFLGHAAHLCDMEGYSYNFAQVYLGAMATSATDLWWRSSFLASLEGKERLDAAEVREGIIFFDMDLLDQPTIGAFL